MKKYLAWMFSGVLAVGLALLLSMTFELVKISDTDVSSDLEPGEMVLVLKLNKEAAFPGDLVYCRLPFHQVGSQDLYCLRRVATVDEDGFSVCKSIDDKPEDRVKIKKEDVIGKILVKVP